MSERNRRTGAAAFISLVSSQTAQVRAAVAADPSRATNWEPWLEPTCHGSDEAYPVQTNAYCYSTARSPYKEVQF